MRVRKNKRFDIIKKRSYNNIIYVYLTIVVVYKHEIRRGTLPSDKPRKIRIAVVKFFSLNNFKMVLSSIVGFWNNIFVSI